MRSSRRCRRDTANVAVFEVHDRRGADRVRVPKEDELGSRNRLIPRLRLNSAITHFANAPVGCVPYNKHLWGQRKCSMVHLEIWLRGSPSGGHFPPCGLSRMKLSAIQRLVLSAVVLVIAMMLGTGYFRALQYRERALEVAERELSNSALLLSRHFDQQLSDLQHVHDDLVASLSTTMEKSSTSSNGRSRRNANEVPGAAELAASAQCRRLQSLERQGWADQFFRDVAGAGRQYCQTGAISGVHVGRSQRRT